MISIDTKHFGPIQIDERDVVVFPEGIYGFEESKRFTLLGKNDGAAPFFWLQSLDQPDVSLVVMDPFAIYDEYSVEVADEELETLAINDPERIMTLCIVVIPEDVKQMRANLKAPILINMENSVGKQVMQHNDSLPIRFFLLQ